MSTRNAVWAVLALAFAGRLAAALPIGGLPALPSLPLPVDLNRTLSRATGALDPHSLTDLRKLRIRELLTTHRNVLEVDPQGAPIVRSEVLALDPAEMVLEAARAAGFEVAEERTLDSLELRVVVLRAPRHLSTRRALALLRKLDPAGAYDFNHIYMDSGTVAREPVSSQSAAADALPADRSRLKIGMIDEGVDASHLTFSGVTIHRHGCEDKAVPSLHGTAVGSLMVGRAPHFAGSAPGAELYAADVYCNAPRGGSMDQIAEAIAWLVREQVAVMNVSLVGPPNLLLQKVVQIAVGRGYLIVAAVGNDGPAAPPLYPASYPGVIGVTGVDAHRQVLLEACRGPQVMFAAPGTDMAAALMAADHSPEENALFAPVRGTSFASPIVAGLLAAQVPSPDKTLAERAVTQLAAQALDLGAPGVDTVYGRGLVGEAARVLPSQVHASTE